MDLIDQAEALLPSFINKDTPPTLILEFFKILSRRKIVKNLKQTKREGKIQAKLERIQTLRARGISITKAAKHVRMHPQTFRRHSERLEEEKGDFRLIYPRLAKEESRISTCSKVEKMIKLAQGAVTIKEIQK